MPIVAADLKYYKSTQAAGDGISLGGAITDDELTSGLLDDLFDAVKGSEATSGDTEYRCIYIKNTHATLTLKTPLAFIQTQTPSPDTSAQIGLGTSAVGGSEPTIADENTAPAGVTFFPAAGSGNGLPTADIPAGSWKAIWIERIVDPAAGAYALDGVTVSVTGETEA